MKAILTILLLVFFTLCNSRETGYYWVRFKPKQGEVYPWCVCEWNKERHCWYWAGSGIPSISDAGLEINEHRLDSQLPPLMQVEQEIARLQIKMDTMKLSYADVNSRKALRQYDSLLDIEAKLLFRGSK